MSKETKAVVIIEEVVPSHLGARASQPLYALERVDSDANLFHSLIWQCGPSRQGFSLLFAFGTMKQVCQHTIIRRKELHRKRNKNRNTLMVDFPINETPGANIK